MLGLWDSADRFVSCPKCGSVSAFLTGDGFLGHQCIKYGKGGYDFKYNENCWHSDQGSEGKFGFHDIDLLLVLYDTLQSVCQSLGFSVTC